LRYWWVNQNQTYRHEIGGGYLWSPKRNTKNRRNPFYETMREIAPGDLVFSFFDTRIAAIGFATSFCYESPKPEEFGKSGLNWSGIGWKVDVRFQQLTTRVRPKDNIGTLRAYLPAKYSPLRPSGDGLQSVYLAEVGEQFAMRLLGLIGAEASTAREVAESFTVRGATMVDAESTVQEWERRIEVQIRQDRTLAETDKHALILARRGQGKFRSAVQLVERACRVTGVERAEHLIASHCKPWRDATHDERLNGENGLLLTPTIDHLFDRGFISFGDNGQLLISPVAHQLSLARMGIPLDRKFNVGAFSTGQKQFLEFHRENVFKETQGRD
jgi:hypothetical protein